MNIKLSHLSNLLKLINTFFCNGVGDCNVYISYVIVTLLLHCTLLSYLKII